MLSVTLGWYEQRAVARAQFLRGELSVSAPRHCRLSEEAGLDLGAGLDATGRGEAGIFIPENRFNKLRV